MLKSQLWLTKAIYVRTPKPNEQIRVEPNVAMVKDLLEEDVGERSNFKKNPTHTQDHGDA